VIVSVIHADTEDGWYLCLTWYPSLHSVELYLPGTVGSHKGVGEGQEEGAIKEGADLDYVSLNYTYKVYDHPLHFQSLFHQY
jgi:hypothetical protein